MKLPPFDNLEEFFDWLDERDAKKPEWSLEDIDPESLDHLLQYLVDRVTNPTPENITDPGHVETDRFLKVLREQEVQNFLKGICKDANLELMAELMEIAKDKAKAPFRAIWKGLGWLWTNVVLIVMLMIAATVIGFLLIAISLLGVVGFIPMYAGWLIGLPLWAWVLPGLIGWGPFALTGLIFGLAYGSKIQSYRTHKGKIPFWIKTPFYGRSFSLNRVPYQNYILAGIGIREWLEPIWWIIGVPFGYAKIIFLMLTFVNPVVLYYLWTKGTPWFIAAIPAIYFGWGVRVMGRFILGFRNWNKIPYMNTQGEYGEGGYYFIDNIFLNRFRTDRQKEIVAGINFRWWLIQTSIASATFFQRTVPGYIRIWRHRRRGVTLPKLWHRFSGWSGIETFMYIYKFESHRADWFLKNDPFWPNRVAGATYLAFAWIKKIWQKITDWSNEFWDDFDQDDPPPGDD